ncbi:MAG: VWA domain-containing protein, partial [Longimicrobiales bacterium]
PSRRVKPALRGRRVDLRRSLRRNTGHGMELLELRRTKRRIRKTRFVLLCDVSGSMDTYNPFLLELMFGIQKVLKGSRTVVFSTRATEISAMLSQRSVAETLRDVARRARHWSGGTDIGEALATLNRRILQQGTPRSTVAIILSDGYDQGEPARIEAEMRALRRRVRKVVWINPLLGTEGYAPIAKGMRAAMPYVDHFLPAHDIASLRALCRDLAKA